MPNIERASTLKIHRLTQEQYDREASMGNIDPDAFYITPDTSVDQDVLALETVQKLLIVSSTQPNVEDCPVGALWIKPLA